MSSVARVIFIKANVIFRYHTKGVSNQVSLNSDFIHVQITVLKSEKKEEVGKHFLGYKTGQ